MDYKFSKKTEMLSVLGKYAKFENKINKKIIFQSIELLYITKNEKLDLPYTGIILQI